MAILKKKLNLTIDEGVLEKAKLLVEKQGGSLSQLVENFLARLADDINYANHDFWLDQFHQKFLSPDIAEPTNDQIDKLQTSQLDKFK